MEIETGRIHVIFPGDRTTGIGDAHFEFKEETHGAGESQLIFEDEESLNEFKDKLAILVMEHLTGYECYCQTNEEYLELLNR